MLRLTVQPALIALAWLSAMSAYAADTPQSATETSSQEASAGKLQEVIVTAQKRKEDLQSVPVSVQVIASDYLQEQNDNSLTDLSQSLPGVHVSTGKASNIISVRGISAGNDNPGFDQAVSIFADDIYRGRSRMSDATFLDLDRIEILKGPQSTFFGNNAIAGALNIVSKKPGDTFDGYVRVLGGMFEQYALEGAAGGPVTDTLRVRLALTADGDERGWLYDVSHDQYVPRIHNLAGRLTFVYQPTEALDATLKLESSHHKTEGASYDQPFQWVNCPSLPPFPVGFEDATGACSVVGALGLPQGYDQKNVSLLGGEQNKLSNDEAVLTLNYRIGGHTFTSVTGYSYYDFLEDVSSGVPTPLVELEEVEHYHQFSQELRLVSPTGQPIEYLVGAYFQTDQLVTDEITNDPFFTPFLAESHGGFVPDAYLPLSYSNGIRQGEKIYSIFGSLAWNATDRLKLSAGLRSSWVHKDYNAYLLFGSSAQVYGGFVEDPPVLEHTIVSAFGVSQGTSQSLTQSDRAVMPSARIQYQFNPDLMAYFRYDRGFLAGGFNGEAIVSFAQIPQFGPEHVNDYEVGLKSKWLDDRMLLNLNLFLADYTDLQASSIAFFTNPITGVVEPTPTVANAANARSQGVEFEWRWLPTADLRLGANVSYLDSYFVSFPNGERNTVQTYCASYGLGTPYCVAQFPGGVPVTNDLTGQATPYAPRWSGSVTAAYTVSLPGGLRLTTEVDPYFTSEYYFFSGDPLFRTGGYVRWDARIALAPEDSRWSLDLIGKNLGDRIILSESNGSIYQFAKEPPRNVALQFRYRW